MSEAKDLTRPVIASAASYFTGSTSFLSLMTTRHSHKNMHYVVYVLENQNDRSWYIGFTTNLKQRLQEHKHKKSPYTSKKENWDLMYAELYLDKFDALGREKFLKSGSGRKFLKKQLTNYLTK